MNTVTITPVKQYNGITVSILTLGCWLEILTTIHSIRAAIVAVDVLLEFTYQIKSICSAAEHISQYDIWENFGARNPI